ncbi:ICE-like protease (caspase) p20 domain protein [Rhizoctonia solani]|uniref:ICE-like protease (Caspase) p20 domain protein n=1 Tax=Rhizoctonia solani TaxID=456999 RepID=A0A8H8P5I1_9AGAM|nr:ICE-like protease (caspase) p20 domain protein [Rhizoctonia solani]QRW26011.1 ICE-like protease (caspase) p20 domain protein [Rhizoctonia solani]
MSFESPLTGTTEKAIVIEDHSEPKLYALVIGINNYKHITPLDGAASDADEIFKFLTFDLKVPPNHIINLRNEQASRVNILQGFRSLVHDPRIKNGDPILIFYAGHGGSYQPSRQQKRLYGAGKIQVIFPQDYKFPIPGSTELVNCIPDKTIGVLLNEIAAAKGNNLTVIFDCCHSASATRTSFPDDGTRQSRSAEVTMDIPEDIDSDIFAPKPSFNFQLPTRYSSTGIPFCTNQSSHVHLAACGDEEKAWEEKGRGAFTVALLKNIRAHGVDKITYRDLMISLPNLPRQSPHCYGAHTTRNIFNSRVPSRRVIFIPAKFERGSLLLQAGAASGVTFQSIWEVYGFPTQDAPSLGRFYAQVPKVAVTELKPENEDQAPLEPTDGRLYARQVAKAAIFESSGSDSGATEPGFNGSEVGYVAHEERDSADITVELDDSGKVAFCINDPRAEEHGLATLKYRKPAQRKEVEKVLFAAAKWHWHLHRAPDNAKERVTIELVKLPEVNEDANDFGDDKNAPEDSYEVLDSETGVVDLVVQPDIPYGGSTSISQILLSSYYIDPLLGSVSGNALTDPELPARNYIIIGRDMGDEIIFMLEPGVKMELGYFKLFWSTDSLELYIGQDSPFDQPADSPEPEREVVSGYGLFRRDWGTALLGLVQRAA